MKKKKFQANAIEIKRANDYPYGYIWRPRDRREGSW
jgi:hypothetical protein